MSSNITQAELEALLEDDHELLGKLIEHDLLRPGTSEFTPEDVATVFVARTLVRELEVNWPGVEIIVRLRAELLATRRQMASFIDLLKGSVSKPRE